MLHGGAFCGIDVRLRGCRIGIGDLQLHPVGVGPLAVVGGHTGEGVFCGIGGIGQRSAGRTREREAPFGVRTGGVGLRVERVRTHGAGVEQDVGGRRAVGVGHRALDADRGVVTERLLGREGDDELGMAVAVFGRKVLRRVEPVDGERIGFGGADLRGGNLAAVEQVDDPLMACSGLGFDAGCLRREREGAQQPCEDGHRARHSQQGVPACVVGCHHLESFFGQ